MAGDGDGDPGLPKPVEHQTRGEHQVARVHEGQELAKHPAQRAVVAVEDADRVLAAELFQL